MSGVTHLKERATAHARAGKLQLAVREFGEALEQWTADDGDALRSACLQNRGLCYQQMEQLESAERDFSAAVEIDPTSPAPYVNRGGVLYLLGRTSTALADFQRYLDLDPEDSLGMHQAVRAHITLCAPPDDIAGGEETPLLVDEPEPNPAPTAPLRRGRSIPQRSTGPTEEWLNGTNIPRPQRWERRRTSEGPRAALVQPAGTSDLVRVSSAVSQQWYKQAAVCGVLAVAAIVALLLYAFV